MLARAASPSDRPRSDDDLPRGNGMNQGSPPKASKAFLWVVLGVAGVILFGALFLVVLGGYLYLKDERLREDAQADALELAKLVAACGVPLPESTGPVPAEVPKKPYHGTPVDWSQPAFTCTAARFSPHQPQLYRFRWVRDSENSGRVVADSDADFDGEADTTIEVRVQCAAGSCRARSPSVTSQF